MARWCRRARFTRYAMPRRFGWAPLTCAFGCKGSRCTRPAGAGLVDLPAEGTLPAQPRSWCQALGDHVVYSLGEAGDEISFQGAILRQAADQGGIDEANRVTIRAGRTAYSSSNPVPLSKPRVRQFSVTVRTMWGGAPPGSRAWISKVISTSAPSRPA